MPDGALPQSGCVARNGIPATDCTEYTTVAGAYTGGGSGDPAALGRAMGALASLAEASVGLYPIVTSQYSSTTLYQFSYHTQYLFS